MPATNRPAIPVAPRQSVLILIDALLTQIVALQVAMIDDDGLGETAARAAPGEVSNVLSKVVGSTISETHTMLLDPTNSADRDHLMLPPWAANRQLIADLWTPAFQRSHQCPGRKKAQCCKAGGDQPCFPNWREREDSEWYALEINKYLSMVNQRLGEVTPIAAALAVDEAFELGCLFAEALIKFQWDKPAMSGEKKLERRQARLRKSPPRRCCGDSCCGRRTLKKRQISNTRICVGRHAAGRQRPDNPEKILQGEETVVITGQLPLRRA